MHCSNVLLQLHYAQPPFRVVHQSLSSKTIRHLPRDLLDNTMNQMEGDLNDPGTSFDMVLTKVPALRSCCALILNNTAGNILGVKLLRLVSRQASEVMVKDVYGYTLELNYFSKFALALLPPSLQGQMAMVHSPKAWRYLRNSELRKLSVLVHPDLDMPARKGEISIASLMNSRTSGRSQPLAWNQSVKCEEAFSSLQGDMRVVVSLKTQINLVQFTRCRGQHCLCSFASKMRLFLQTQLYTWQFIHDLYITACE